VRSRSWWWAYFALSVVMNLVLILLARSPLDAVNAVFSGLGLVCLWGYIRGLAVGWRQLWAVYLLLNLLLSLVSLSLNAGEVPFALLAISTVFAFPLFLANYRYAFKRPEIWRSVSPGMSASGR
jgi:hypothetical protein